MVSQAAETSGIGSAGNGGLGRVILASRSPRRRELLREAGIDHEVMLPGFDDSALEPGDVAAEAWVSSLAYLKASSVAREMIRAGVATGDAFIVGADTTCVVKDARGRERFVGTPQNEQEAREMIREFVGREHAVVTGVAIVRVENGRLKRELFVDRATVTLGELSEAQINDYVASGAWRGKAGGYNLTDRVEAGWPLTWSGDPATIVGLPIGKLVARLRRSPRTPRPSGTRTLSPAAA
ncbi:MAG: Maf family protein [Planctomycetota bacterium]|nr:Maf family protein [Planctomycetota bacterium]